MKIIYVVTMAFGTAMLCLSLHDGAWKAVPFAVMLVVFPALALIKWEEA